MTLYAYTDGASRGNPGESGIGIIIKDEEGGIIFSACGYIGITTNNSAEYQALIACLTKASATACEHLVVHSDSELMVRQMQGKYRVKDKTLQDYFRRVQNILARAKFQLTIKHIARELNHEADLLANSGIDNRQPIQV